MDGYFAEWKNAEWQAQDHGVSLDGGWSCWLYRWMDASDKAAESSAAEAAESETAEHTSQTDTEQTYGCSHYQRKCSLVVCTESL